MSELQDPFPLKEQIDKDISDLFEFNQKVVQVLRQQALDFATLATFFSQQAQRAMDIHNNILELALISAQNTGNILVAEFGIPEEEDEEEEDEDE